MKIVGTGSRKISKLPMKTKAQSCDMHLVAYRSCSHIFHMWKKESSPDFSETPLMLCLYYSKKLGNISWGNHCSYVRWLEWFTLHLKVELWTLVTKLQCRAIFMNPTMWYALRGRLLPKNIFYKYKLFILSMSLYLYQCFIISME